MALKWIEGFELAGGSDYLSRKYLTAISGASSTPGRLHGRYGRGTLTTPSLGLTGTWIVGFALFVPTTPTASENYVALFRAGKEQIKLQVNSSRQLELVRGVTTVETGSTVLPAETWVYIEMKILVKGGATGTYEVRINEVTEMSDTSVATGFTTNDDADAVKFVAGSSTRLDDIYVCDGTGSAHTDFLGDQVVEGILPSGDGAATDWTPSTGSSHYTLVDDPAAGFDSGDYVSASSTGLKDYYDFGNLSVITGSINGVVVNVMAALDAVGARTMRARYRDGVGTEYGSASPFTVGGTSAAEQMTVFGLNPLTTAAWTPSEVNAAQFGIELVS